MYLRRFYDEKLAQASYLMGCAVTGEALVIDPLRDVAPYEEAAAAEGMRVTHVTETHIHADFVSGARELAARGAVPFLSGEGGRDWSYGWAEETGAVLLRDGDHFLVGNIRIDVMHTPGHTPEHVVFVVTDTAAADEPMGVFTGDLIFVGDVGRPDLLEKAAGVAGTMECGARDLYHSLRRFMELPDHVQIWPGHGAGSACGKALGAVPQSTVGYERRFIRALACENDAEFVRTVLEGQPAPPRYFGEMKRQNRDGPRLLAEIAPPVRRGWSELEGVLEAGGLVVDTRPAADYGRGHVPGTLNIPLNRSFTTWAGWLLPYDRDVHLIVGAGPDDAAVAEAVRDLSRIGLDRIVGYFTADVITERPSSPGGGIGRIRAVTAAELVRLLGTGEAVVLDVRESEEWRRARIPASIHVPLGELPDRLDAVPRDRTVIVQCRSGARSAIGASLLEAHGWRDVRNLAGGLLALRAAGVETASGETDEADGGEDATAVA